MNKNVLLIALSLVSVAVCGCAGKDPESKLLFSIKKIIPKQDGTVDYLMQGSNNQRLIINTQDKKQWDLGTKIYVEDLPGI